MPGRTTSSGDMTMTSGTPTTGGVQEPQTTLPLGDMDILVRCWFCGETRSCSTKEVPHPYWHCDPRPFLNSDWGLGRDGSSTSENQHHE